MDENPQKTFMRGPIGVAKGEAEGETEDELEAEEEKDAEAEKEGEEVVDTEEEYEADGVLVENALRNEVLVGRTVPEVVKEVVGLFDFELVEVKKPDIVLFLDGGLELVGDKENLADEVVMLRVFVEVVLRDGPLVLLELLDGDTLLEGEAVSLALEDGFVLVVEVVDGERLRKGEVVVDELLLFCGELLALIEEDEL